MQSFLQSYQKNNPADSIDELDLYKAEIPVIDGEVLEAWIKTENQLTTEEKMRLAKIDHFTRQFLNADKVVIAAPMWNLQFPPNLIAYIATITVAGKTFAYSETGWQGLVPDKPVLLLHVRGGVFSHGPAKAYDHAVPYLQSIFSILGISNFKTIICEGIEEKPDKADVIFQQAVSEATALAERF
jgi:FMN-dependent NADH-azoreductase